MFLFQFLNGARVANTVGEFQLTTIFQGPLKIVANRHKRNNTLPQKNSVSLLGQKKSKIK
jgi:hypothetical protein